MTSVARGGAVWRVGHRADPLGFTPHELCAWNHRFDDAARRFRTLYVAERPETALRETMADFRPSAAALARYRAAMGADAESDLSRFPITASWRRQHVLASARLLLDGPVCDMNDIGTRHALEERHADLLSSHGMSHLDMHELTSRRRAVTQTIAGTLYDEGAAGIRFPSRLDGLPCVAVFEGRGRLSLVAEALALTDPAPDELVEVAASWQLALEPATAASDDLGWSDADSAAMIEEEPW